MVGKLAPNSSHFTRGLVKHVPGRGYFRAVPSQNGDKFATSPTSQSLNDSDLKHRLQNFINLATPRKLLTTGGALLDGTAEGVLQGNQILVRVDVVVVPGTGRNLFSIMTVAKKDIVTIFDYKNPRLGELNVAVPLRSKSGNLFSFVLDLSIDGYGAKELEIDVFANG